MEQREHNIQDIEVKLEELGTNRGEVIVENTSTSTGGKWYSLPYLILSISPPPSSSSSSSLSLSLDLRTSLACITC